MSPEDLDPADDERGAEDCRLEHYAKRGERLILARRQPGQLALHELQRVHDLSEVIAGLGGLAESEALGIEVGHVSCVELEYFK